MATEDPNDSMRGVRRLALMVNAYGEALVYDFSETRDALVADFNRALVKAVTEDKDGLLSLFDPDFLHERVESERLGNEERRQKLQAKEGG